ncbi:hypothetical protein QWZ14_29245 [Paeniroseomonas aquatica]|uniref:Uncharacterized protein n=1 Tax=Paeniroseomonas aquatica TaxID=373043 RepID=A0ABT8AG30_9PROT|nr:hypothetical protein [Paeniroseomonas aquatica]MDN3568483.1 hypothetical protein [Paeniroseomonas aquatica]
MISETSYDFGSDINILTGRVDGIAASPSG